MRFYGIDPLRLADLADYPELWGILTSAIEPLRAEEMLNATSVATVPHAKRGDQQSFRRKLERLTRTYEARKPVEPEEPVERDPSKAAEWFRMKGVEVVKSEE